MNAKLAPSFRIAALLGLMLSAISLSGCSGGNTKPDREWITVSCNGFANWENCNKQAYRFCPEGFDIGTKQESLIEQKRQMEFACKR